MVEYDITMNYSLIPPNLILTMLNREDFASYRSGGTEGTANEQEIFLGLKRYADSSQYWSEELRERIEEKEKECVPHEDGRPKKSVYVPCCHLEDVPFEVIEGLYLVTMDHRVLCLEPREELPKETEGGLNHLYKEIVPTPYGVSKLGHREFAEFLIKVGNSAACFAELRLDKLAEDPYADRGNLPYSKMGHLRSCLVGLDDKISKTKFFLRNSPPGFPYRMIKHGSGIYLSKMDEEGVLRMLFFPLPSEEELKAKNYDWWHTVYD